jgi:hypothetical protein
VHGVGGDTLGSVNGGGIAETGRGAHIVERQPDGEVATVVADRQVTAPADTGDGPPVAVFHPVGGTESESAVVAARDDHISDTGLISIGQSHLRSGRGVIKTMRPGTAVEFSDKLAAWGEHDRVEPRRPIGNPSGERIRSHGCHVADMNTIVIKIEVERRRLAVPEAE